MTDYNDGNWHGWNGGECPVNKMSEIDATLPNGVRYRDMPAGSASWSGAMLFRVTKEHKEPREFWLVDVGVGKLDVNFTGACGGTHVREVTK